MTAGSTLPWKLYAQWRGKGRIYTSSFASEEAREAAIRRYQVLGYAVFAPIGEAYTAAELGAIRLGGADPGGAEPVPGGAATLGERSERTGATWDSVQ